MRPHESIFKKTPAHYTYHTLVATATECPLCFWLLKWLDSFSNGPKAKFAETGRVRATLHIGEYEHEEREFDQTYPEGSGQLRIYAELWTNPSTESVASFVILLRALVKGSNGYEAVVRYANDLFRQDTYTRQHKASSNNHARSVMLDANTGLAASMHGEPHVVSSAPCPPGM